MDIGGRKYYFFPQFYEPVLLYLVERTYARVAHITHVHNFYFRLEIFSKLQNVNLLNRIEITMCPFNEISGE